MYIYFIYNYTIIMCGGLRKQFYISVTIKTTTENFNFNKLITYDKSDLYSDDVKYRKLINMYIFDEQLSETDFSDLHIEYIDASLHDIIDGIYNLLSLENPIEEMSIISTLHHGAKFLLKRLANLIEIYNSEQNNNLKRINIIKKIGDIKILSFDSNALYLFDLFFPFNNFINLKILKLTRSTQLFLLYDNERLYNFLDNIDLPLEILILDYNRISECKKMTNLPITLKYLIINVSIESKYLRDFYELHSSKLPFGAKLFINKYTFDTISKNDKKILLKHITPSLSYSQETIAKNLNGINSIEHEDEYKKNCCIC